MAIGQPVSLLTRHRNHEPIKICWLHSWSFVEINEMDLPVHLLEDLWENKIYNIYTGNNISMADSRMTNSDRGSTQETYWAGEKIEGSHIGQVGK